jgi:hypothetical protein
VAVHEKGVVTNLLKRHILYVFNLYALIFVLISFKFNLYFQQLSKVFFFVLYFPCLLFIFSFHYCLHFTCPPAFRFPVSLCFFHCFMHSPSTYTNVHLSLIILPCTACSSTLKGPFTHGMPCPCRSPAMLCR